MKQLDLRGILWILGVITLFMASSEMQSLKPVYRNKTVNQGSTVNLTCTDKSWSEMIYTIWKMDLRKKKCQIGVDFSDRGRDQNSCDDGKTLHNKSTGESYLFIPNILNTDEGVYDCESVYKGGSDTIIFALSVTVPPHMSATLQCQGGSRRVAVCLAEGGKPAASIVWKNVGENDSSLVPRVSLEHHPDGFYTVESQIDVPEGAASENLTCAVQHPFWDKEQIIIPQACTASSTGPVLWGWVLIALLAVSVIGFLLGLLFFTQRNLRHCWRSNTSSTTIASEAKSPPTVEEVEEVEPYASYVQRVNSIYDSSADLFT